MNFLLFQLLDLSDLILLDLQFFLSSAESELDLNGLIIHSVKCKSCSSINDRRMVTGLDLSVQKLSCQILQLSLLDHIVGKNFLPWRGYLVACWSALIRLQTVRRILGSDHAARSVQTRAQVLIILDWRMAIPINLLHEDVDIADVADTAIGLLRIDIKRLEIITKRMANNCFVFNNFFDL